LSDRGSLAVDTRTNTIIVNDTQAAISTITDLVATLDRPTPQIMIESRIVESSRNFLRDLGVQLAGRTEEKINASFPNAVSIFGAGTRAGSNVPGNFILDLPAQVGTGAGGSLGISFASIGGSFLDVHLSALESSGRGKVISRPRIATLDNTEALIQSGRRIPFETTSANQGTQTQFADASISLRVTPRVTPHGFINMKIVASRNAADFTRTSRDGVPTIITREATTEMLVRDGDTVVIGGLYTHDMSTSEDGVPLFSKIPVLGWLFRRTRNLDTTDELLFFITPRIIREPQESLEMLQ
jgi:type IV pilus assembly protein PilQ